MKFIAFKCRIGIALRPRSQASALARHILQADAINRANRNAQLATGAVRLYHGVHHLVAAQYGVGRASGQTKRAADAPGLVNYRHAARAFQAILWIDGLRQLSCNCSQFLHTFHATGWALVDGGIASCNSLCIGRAIRVAAARALRLRQRSVNALT